MITTDWHHAPIHRFVPGAIHMITAGTLHKKHFFKTKAQLDLMQETLLEHIKISGWEIRAWACFSNHYHVIVKTSEQCGLSGFVQGLHQKLGYRLNRLDAVTDRTVMYEYWDKCISFDSSYHARMRYVMQNPVKHGLVDQAETYPWCSAFWFQNHATPAYQRRISTYKIDKVNEPDDFFD